MSAGPFYAGIPSAKSGRLTTGDNSRTAPTQSQVIFDPGANGGACMRINTVPLATVIASVIRVFLYDGSAYHLLFERPLAAQTVTASTPVLIDEISAVNMPGRFPIMVPATWQLKATVNDTQTGIEVTGQGGAG